MLNNPVNTLSHYTYYFPAVIQAIIKRHLLSIPIFSTMNYRSLQLFKPLLYMCLSQFCSGT